MSKHSRGRYPPPGGFPPGGFPPGGYPPGGPPPGGFRPGGMGGRGPFSGGRGPGCLLPIIGIVLAITLIILIL